MYVFFEKWGWVGRVNLFLTDEEIPSYKTTELPTSINGIPFSQNQFQVIRRERR
jgi:hypothetical protein